MPATIRRSEGRRGAWRFAPPRAAVAASIGGEEEKGVCDSAHAPTRDGRSEHRKETRRHIRCRRRHGVRDGERRAVEGHNDADARRTAPSGDNAR
jgi:hypothetical protein